MQCDMCGVDTELVLAQIEGTNLNVCNKCARYGKIIQKKQNLRPNIFKKNNNTRFKKEEKEILILEDYPSKIRNSREKRKLTQEQFAKMLNEKTSLIQSLENGKIEPSEKLARKLEKILKIKLIEEIKNNIKTEYTNPNKKGPLTIGDLLKIKK
jgi:putative transcription factor